MGAGKNRACERDMQGERRRLPKRPMKIVSTRFLRVQKILISQEAPEGISVCVR